MTQLHRLCWKELLGVYLYFCTSETPLLLLTLVAVLCPRRNTEHKVCLATCLLVEVVAVIQLIREHHQAEGAGMLDRDLARAQRGLLMEIRLQSCI